ncbi:AbrB/MazE/SpoVT family DNA-binding domain-containing protein [Effusibacillus lacus]|uniref:AbrB family transcriptional regulator n=1 Tax=Effusibacillus lacus TaxID=1348429 RepID=A0A292YCU7_9BACL|nr:AbrB/MazE/SpoVT family DNA-binding domain-containing protein [Effusibacillus lacus]TCS70520.1 AbrB family looped-hinge helix DNA binding protein [Effusibacillus lacus]GAX89532.1 AbrB family transcriptional regulator [Effusibacillus lacus]
MLTTKVSSKGQIVIPSDIRKAIKLEEGDTVTLEILGEGKVLLRPVKMKPLKSLRGALAPKDGIGVELDYKALRNEAWQAVADKKRSRKEE